MSAQVAIDRRAETRTVTFAANSATSATFSLAGFSLGSFQMPTLAGGASTVKIQVSIDGQTFADLVDYEAGVTRPAESVSNGSVHYLPTEAFAFPFARLAFNAADSATDETDVLVSMVS